MIAGGMPISIALPLSECVVPSSVVGPVAVFVTSDNQPLVNNVVFRTDISVVAGPTIIFIDSVSEEIGSIVRPSGIEGEGEGEGDAESSEGRRDDGN